MQLIAFEKANNLYDKGIACLKPWHTNDFLILNGLKGAIHTYIHRYKEADAIFTTALNSIAPNTLMDRKKINWNAKEIIQIKFMIVDDDINIKLNNKKWQI